jgi:hypothetical protein
MNKALEDAIEDYVGRYGEKSLLRKLCTTRDETSVLTIIANAGVHPYHELHMRGDIFVASQGNLDFSSAEASADQIRQVLTKVAIKLKEKRWNKVYLVPFGPAPLSLQIKSLVHKVLDIETIDVLHAGGGVHFDIELDPRKIAIDAKKEL